MGMAKDVQEISPRLGAITWVPVPEEGSLLFGEQVIVQTHMRGVQGIGNPGQQRYYRTEIDAV
jgi:hypothetical protein